MGFQNQIQEKAKAAAEDTKTIIRRKTLNLVNYWTPTENHHTVRIFPIVYKVGDETKVTYFVKKAVHFGIGIGERKGNFTCPLFTDDLVGNMVKYCPICERRKELKSTGDPIDDEEANKLGFRDRWMLLVQLINSPDGNAVWSIQDVKNLEEQAKQNGLPTDNMPKPGDTRLYYWSTNKETFHDISIKFTYSTISEFRGEDGGMDMDVLREGMGAQDTKFVCNIIPKPSTRIPIWQGKEIDPDDVESTSNILPEHGAILGITSPELMMMRLMNTEMEEAKRLVKSGMAMAGLLTDGSPAEESPATDEPTGDLAHVTYGKISDMIVGPNTKTLLKERVELTPDAKLPSCLEETLLWDPKSGISVEDAGGFSSTDENCKNCLVKAACKSEADYKLAASTPKVEPPTARKRRGGTIDGSKVKDELKSQLR